MAKHISEFGLGIPTDSKATELRKLPRRDWNDELCGITSLVIIPNTKRSGLHDSGFRCMSFAACNGETAYCLLGGYSDVIHIGGIGGFNDPMWHKNRKYDDTTLRTNWSIDCLPKSGLLRLFCHGELIIGPDYLSSFEVYSGEKKTVFGGLE